MVVLVENAYTLSPFVCFMYLEGMEDRAPSGYRMSVLRWKTPKDKMDAKTKRPVAGYVARSAVAVLVPSIVLSVEPSELQDAMSEALTGLQDAAIREFVDGRMTAFPGIALRDIVVPYELGTPTGLAAFSAKIAASARLSNESIAKWYDATLHDALLEMLVEKIVEKSLVVDAEDAPAMAIAQAAPVRKALVSLASPRTTMPRAVAVQLAKALGAAPSEDRVRKQLEARLEVFINPPSEAALELAL